MSGDPTYDDLEPGLHRRPYADPEQRARSVAAHLRADLCTTTAEVDDVLARRSGPPVDATVLAELRLVARRLGQAERVAARTRDRAVIDVERRLSASAGGLAVHPTTVRDRAAAVQAARTELLEAERAVAAHAATEADAAAADQGSGPTSAASPGPDNGGSAMADGLAGPTLKERRSRSIAAIAIGFGVGLLLLGFGVVPLWVALLPGLAACTFALRYLSPPDTDRDQPAAGYREESSLLLAQVSAAADEVFGIAPLGGAGRDEGALLAARRDRAEEEVRVAERAWRELAGEGSDVEDVEAVVRRFDPQHDDARLLASETVGVRAAEVVVHQLQQRWQALWAGFGREAPAPEGAEATMASLSSPTTRPIVLAGTAAGRGAEVAAAAPGAVVLVFEAMTAEAPAAPAQPDEVS